MSDDTYLEYKIFIAVKILGVSLGRCKIGSLNCETCKTVNNWNLQFF